MSSVQLRIRFYKPNVYQSAISEYLCSLITLKIQEPGLNIFKERGVSGFAMYSEKNHGLVFPFLFFSVNLKTKRQDTSRMLDGGCSTEKRYCAF